MNLGLVARQYATALFNYALKTGELDIVYQKAKLISSVCYEVPKLISSLENPVLSNDNKKKLIITAAGGNVPVSFDKFIDLILKNNREDRIQYIALKFIDLYHKNQNIQHSLLITAIELDDDTKERLTLVIEKESGKKQIIDFQTDSSLLGGLILQIGDKRWDASVSSKLNAIRMEWKEINRKSYA